MSTLYQKIQAWCNFNGSNVSIVLGEIFHTKAKSDKKGLLAISNDFNVILLDKDIAQKHINKEFSIPESKICIYSDFHHWYCGYIKFRLTTNENNNNDNVKHNQIFILCDIEDIPQLYFAQKVDAYVVAGNEGLYPTKAEAIRAAYENNGTPDGYIELFKQGVYRDLSFPQSKQLEMPL